MSALRKQSGGLFSADRADDSFLTESEPVRRDVFHVCDHNTSSAPKNKDASMRLYFFGKADWESNVRVKPACDLRPVPMTPY